MSQSNMPNRGGAPHPRYIPPIMSQQRPAQHIAASHSTTAPIPAVPAPRSGNPLQNQIFRGHEAGMEARLVVAAAAAVRAATTPTTVAQPSPLSNRHDLSFLRPVATTKGPPAVVENVAGPDTAAIPYMTAPIDDLVRNLMQDGILRLKNFRHCKICRENYLIKCHGRCIFRPSANNPAWRRPDGTFSHNPVWRRPDGTLRPNTTEAACCLREHVAWRQFQDMSSLKDVDSRAASVLTLLVGSDVPASSYPRLVRDSDLFIIIFLKRMLDTAPTGTRQQQRVLDELSQRILENYCRAHPGKEPMRTQHFEHWLDELRDKCYAVYGRSVPHRNNVSGAARLGGAAGSSGAGTSTAEAAQNVTDFISNEFIMRRVFDFWPVDSQEQGAAATTDQPQGGH